MKPLANMAAKMNDDTKLINDDKKMHKGDKKMHNDERWVTINVGGVTFETSLGTVKSLRSEYLNDMIYLYEVPADGVYRIDRDPECFRMLLNFARSGKLTGVEGRISPELLLDATRFYQLNQDVCNVINEYIEQVYVNRKIEKQMKVMKRYKSFEKQCLSMCDLEEVDCHMQRMVHHNKIDISVGPEMRLGKRRRRPIDDITCYPEELFKDSDDHVCDVMKYVRDPERPGYEEVYVDELCNKHVQCVSCERKMPIKRDIGWCHKCLLCYRCQGPWCVTPDTFIGYL
ncbi:unnamed protein product [Owenia fusiformis]|uniref:Uncharacterized protein n=1 Tax=Owenia fusiformis TaxID=6347 RepID=A0A8J1TUD8_OWEFU|nr:unnamed protein product [Owenia fusiformis]